MTAMTSSYVPTTKDIIDDLLTKDLAAVKAAGEPLLTEMDSLLVKIVKRKPLTEKEHVRFIALTKALGMNDSDLAVRAEILAGSDPYYKARGLVHVGDYRRPRERVFGDNS